MRYVATDPNGVQLQGVKELSWQEASRLRRMGFKLARFEGNDMLSRAASAIWRQRMAEPDPMGDPSGDCGDAIAAYHREQALRVVEAAGFLNPGAYNDELVARMVGPDGKVSYTVSYLLHILAIEDVCPQCGSALDVTKHWTRNYGGGWDTFEKCPNCGYAEVYV